MSDVVGLDADLVLTIDRALDQVTALEQALTEAVTGIAVTLDTADASASIEEAIASAVATPVAVEADASSIPTTIDEAVQSANPDVVVDADTSAIPNEVAAAVAAIPPVTLEVDADLAGVTQQVTDLGSEASKAEGGTEGLGGSVAGIGAAAGVAEGSVKELVSTVGELGGESTAAAAGGVLALGAATATFFEEGLQAVSAGQRFDFVLGDMAEKIKEIDVNGLNTDVETLGIQFGSTASEMENVNSKLFQNAINAGISKDKAVEFTQQIETLSARAIALNPQLGTLADVSSGLGDKLARGGRFAQLYGIQLTASEIATRALVDTGKTEASQLTIIEKSMAGAELASEKYGATLAGTVAEGSKNAAIQAESLKATFKEAIEQIGVPIVAPVLDILKEAEPDAVAIAQVLGELVKDVLPAVADALTIIGPPLQLVETIFEAIPSPIVTATVAVLGANAALGFLSEAILGVEVSLGPLGVALAATTLSIVALSDLFSGGGPVDPDAIKGIDEGAKAFEDLSKSVHDSITEEIHGAAQSREFVEVLLNAHSTVEDLNRALGFGGEAWNDYVKRVVDANQNQSIFDSHLQTAIEDLDHLKTTTEESAQATIEKAQADGLLTDAQVEEAESAAGQIEGKTNYAAALNALQPIIADNTIGTDGLTAAQEKQKKTEEESTQAAKDHADAIYALNQSMLDVIDSTLNSFTAALKLSNAQIASKKSVDELNKATADGTTTQDELTKKTNDALSAILDEATANADLEAAQDKANGKTQTATEKQQALVTELSNVANTLAPESPLRKQLDEYIFTIAATPTDKHTDFQVETEDALKKWHAYIDELANGTPYQLETQLLLRTPGPKAAGGPVDAWKPYLIGEVGPELFVPKVPGVIVPNYALHESWMSRQDRTAPTPAAAPESPLIGSLTLVTASPSQSATAVLQRVSAARRIFQAKR